jgi:hypothetical protein
MGKADAERGQVPTLTVQFVDVDTDEERGTSTVLEATFYKMPPRKTIPRNTETARSPFDFRPTINSLNANYYREFADYMHIHRLVNPIRLKITNTGTTTILNARLRIVLEDKSNLQVLRYDQLPEFPRYATTLVSMDREPVRRPTGIDIQKRGGKYDIQIDFGNIQPKSENISQNIYIGAEYASKITFEGVVYADNLANPVRAPLTVTINLSEESVDVDTLLKYEKFGRRERLRQLKELYGEEDDDDRDWEIGDD